MEQATLSIRVNSKDKKEFDAFCNSIGINVSTAINMFIKAVLREQKIPFEIKSDNFDAYIYDKLREAEKEMKDTDLRYNSNEILNSMKDVIDNV